MSWVDDKLKLYSVSRPVVVANILAFIEANQTEALSWAKDELDFDGDVPDFTYIYNSAGGRVHPNFPDLMLIRRATRFEDSGDPDEGRHTAAVHTLGFEAQIADPDPDDLTAKVEVYQTALKALLWSMESSDLLGDLPVRGRAHLEITDDDGDVTRGDAGQYLQTPHVIARVTVFEV
jgi:hypothetical protein